MKDNQNKQVRRYKSVNLSPESFDLLIELSEVLSNEYASPTIGGLVTNLIKEKLNSLKK